MTLTGIILIFVGVIFSFLSGLGVLRMPDLYNRLQAGTKASTLGVIAIGIGGIFLMPQYWTRFLLIIIFVAATNPVSSSYLARTYHRFTKDDALLKEDTLDESKGEQK